MPPSRLSTIIKNRGSISKSSVNERREINGLKCVFEDVDEVVLKWVHVVHKMNVSVSRSHVK